MILLFFPWADRGNFLEGGREKGPGCWVGPVPSQMVFTRITSLFPSVSLHPHIPT